MILMTEVMSTFLPIGIYPEVKEEDHRIDDRSYEHLPSYRYPEVKEEDHRMAMVRFNYYLLTMNENRKQKGLTSYHTENRYRGVCLLTRSNSP
jgi:hypothetical protein